MSKKNYNKISTATPKADPIEPTSLDAVIEEAVEEALAEVVVETVSEPEVVMGTVFNCQKLNIRKEPRVNADILCVVPAGTELCVCQDNSTGEWLNVTTEAGINGYCMKAYISVKA